MSVVRRVGVAVLPLLFAAACASAPPEFTQPSPTSVPPAVAFVDEQPPSLAFAENIETLVGEAGLWAEVANNADLAECLRNASGSVADTAEGLRGDLEAIGEGGQLIIADCLTGA